MIAIQSRSSRPYGPTQRTARRRAAITLLCAVACGAAAVASHGTSPTGTPDATTIESSSARGGVSQMSAMKAEG